MTVRLPSYSKMKFPHLKRLVETVGLVLASGSPRRRRLLTQIGFTFETLVPEAEESLTPGLPPDQQAISLARQKLDAIDVDRRRAYLTCDTIVVLDGQILNKPVDKSDAMRILKILSGRQHSVFSAVVLYDSKNDVYYQAAEESRVRFNDVSESQLAEYIATGEPLDKAGAYGIQGMGRFLVDSVEGNIDNVIGLPMNVLEHLAGQFWKRYER